jgi:hypothetical protein
MTWTHLLVFAIGFYMGMVVLSMLILARIDRDKKEDRLHENHMKLLELKRMTDEALRGGK